MGIEEYLEILQNQIRDKCARKFVADEIRGHIEDQIRDNIEIGMGEDEAISSAVKDMGDPVKVGVELDRIHRPQFEWKFFIMVIIMSMGGMILQFFIAKYIGDVKGYISSYLFPMIIGLCGMLIAYRLDYTFFLRRSKIIAIIHLLLLIVLPLMSGPLRSPVDGAIWLKLGSKFIRLSMNAYMLLYIPLYAGVLYENRRKRKCIMTKLLIWMFMPILIVSVMETISLPYIGLLLLIEIVLLLTAIYRKWYVIDIKEKILLLIAIPLTSLIISFVWYITRGKYQSIRNINQMERVKNWISHFAMTASENSKTVYSFLGKIITNSNWISRSEKAIESLQEYDGYGNNKILEAIMAYYGILAMFAALACCLLVIFYMFNIVAHMRNELGFIIGTACSLSIGGQIVFYLLIMLGLLPSTGFTLPILSFDSSFLIVDYIMFGTVMSVYRYKEIRKESNYLKDYTPEKS